MTRYTLHTRISIRRALVDGTQVQYQRDWPGGCTMESHHPVQDFLTPEQAHEAAVQWVRHGKANIATDIDFNCPVWIAGVNELERRVGL